jgi:hypothetical protein
VVGSEDAGESLAGGVTNDFSLLMKPGKFLDMVMLACPGGEERTADEYGALLAKAGFRMTRVVPTDSAASVVEAVLA